MGPVSMVFRSELARRWASWSALALLVAIVGATVLTGVSTAQKTSSAFSSFTDRYGYDAFVFSSDSTNTQYLHRPYVKSAAHEIVYSGGEATTGGRSVPSLYLVVLSLPTPQVDSTLKLLSGRLPVGPREVVAGFSFGQEFGLHLGSRITVPFYGLSQAKELFGSNSNVTPHGPLVTFHVVGFAASEIDFPSSTPTYSLLTSRAFGGGVGRHIATGGISSLRLVHGLKDMPRLQAYVNRHESPQGFCFLINEDAGAASIAGSIQPQATGWWLFALFALLAGLAIVGQALSRQSRVESEAYSTLTALGMRPRQLLILGLARAGVIGFVGALGALALVFAVSPLTPVGEARVAATTEGFLVSPLLLGVGAIAVVAFVVVLAFLPSWRVAQSRFNQDARDETVRRANAVATSVGRLGAPPSMLVGVHNALDHGRGRNSVPVATALVGAVIAMTALVATTVFGASLSHLVSTPRLYGQNWQLDMGNMSTAQVRQALATLVPDHEVTKVTWGFSGEYIQVGTTPVEGIFAKVAKGPMAFSLVDGHYPKGDSQIALGATTLHQAGLHVGSRTKVTITGPSGTASSRWFTVVGSVALPPTFSIGGLGVGAVLPFHAALLTACSSSPAPAPCIHKLETQVSGWGILVGMAPGAAGRAELARLQRQFSKVANVLSVPVNLVNFGQAVDFPLLLGLTLALFGAATLAHLLFVSVRRRRRQMALLKTLGFVRRQVVSAICWQAATVALVGVITGLPLGIVLGRFAWRFFASYLGAVPVAVTPVALVSGIAVVVLAGGVALALIPAILASRVRPGEALRES